MRGKRAARDSLFSLLEEMVAIFCAMILPRLLISAFGSRYNGLTTSITQFLSCAVLLRSGIGGATRAALYKPLAEKNHDDFNAIVKATDLFMKRIGLILALLIVLFASVYPFIIRNEFGWLFTFSLFVIIGASTFAESFFGITYTIILQADQRLWISSLLKSICNILNTILAVILIKSHASIHTVKLVSAAIFVLYPFVLSRYVKKTYHINLHVEPNYVAISQRWDAFWQQVAMFVMNNTDVMVLTVCSNMLEVSVYSVYYMVFYGLKRFIVSFSHGIEAAFGNMIAKKQYSVLQKNLVVYENIIFAVSTVTYSCAFLLIIDFVKIYTKGVSDVNYIRTAFAALLVVAGFINVIRIPYQLVVQAAGHYKQTKKGAIIEPVINICLSVVLVFHYGLIGVAVGTLVATIFRTIQYSVYMSRHIVHRSIWRILGHFVAAIIEASIIILIVNCLNIQGDTGYGPWLIKASIVFLISLITVFSCNFICFPNDTKDVLNKLFSLLPNKETGQKKG